MQVERSKKEGQNLKDRGKKRLKQEHRSKEKRKKQDK